MNKKKFSKFYINNQKEYIMAQHYELSSMVTPKAMRNAYLAIQKKFSHGQHPSTFLRYEMLEAGEYEESIKGELAYKTTRNVSGNTMCFEVHVDPKTFEATKIYLVS
jgi:hypothetical protein